MKNSWAGRVELVEAADVCLITGALRTLVRRPPIASIGRRTFCSVLRADRAGNDAFFAVDASLTGYENKVADRERRRIHDRFRRRGAARDLDFGLHPILLSLAASEIRKNS